MSFPTPSSQTAAAACPRGWTLEVVREPDQDEKYGHRCPVYSECYFAFACASMNGNPTSPIKRVRLEKDEIIYRNQTDTECVYVILSGILATFFYLPTGEPVIVGTLGKGQTVGEVEAFRPNKGPYNVKAITPVTLCRLPLDFLNQFLELFPALTVNFVTASESTAFSMTRQLWVMSAHRVYDRLARLLIVLSHLGVEKADGATPIGVSHEDLGFLINADRISITHSLHKLEKENLIILAYKKISIRDELVSRFSNQNYMALVT
jgi:CRP/FNR family transcriptional regulator